MGDIDGRKLYMETRAKSIRVDLQFMGTPNIRRGISVGNRLGNGLYPKSARVSAEVGLCKGLCNGRRTVPYRGPY